MKKKFLIPIVVLFASLMMIVSAARASDSTYIFVHFLYGSKPLPGYKHVEKKWFGGMMGGHVGVGLDSSNILNFGHTGKFHIFSKRHNRHSHYMCHSMGKFNCIFGGDSTQMKTLTIFIPVSKEQSAKLDSLKSSYLQASPYDYALFGMRCGAASYDMLAILGIVPKYSESQTALKIFYPKKLRKRLLKLAAENGWAAIKQEGTSRRCWESD
jgi:hypothetical protein